MGGEYKKLDNIALSIVTVSNQHLKCEETWWLCVSVIKGAVQ